MNSKILNIIVGLIVVATVVGVTNLAFVESSMQAPTENVPFALKFGETAQVGPSEITFKAFLQDSRCPEGVQCIRAGDATILIHDKGLYGDGDFELTTPENPAKNKINYGGDGGIGYYLELMDLEPYPRVGDTAAPEYKATLKMTIDAE